MEKKKSMTQFETATRGAHRLIDRLVAGDIEPTTVADAFITQALALWGADTGRKADATCFLLAWAAPRGEQ